MTSRERVQVALDHKEPDRVPIDLGGSVVTSIGITPYKALRRHLGLPEKEIRTAELVQQIAFVDEDVMEMLGADVLPVFSNPPSGYTVVLEESESGGTSFKDEFGAVLEKPKGCLYYDWREFPLPEPSIKALEIMSWPDPTDIARCTGLRERTLELRSKTDYALFGMAPCGHDLLNQFFRVRGMENALMDLVLDEDFAEAFLERLTTTIMKAQELFLDEVGDLVDVHFAADDISGQLGPLISPQCYRRLVKPRWARIISLIKSKTKAKVFYHTCGAVDEFIPDLIDIGVDILNPVQVSAVGMDSAVLKRKYGDNICFWGGGCDTQTVLPGGSPSQVRDEVKARVGDFAPGGGFVFNPVHNIQPGVSSENIVAMFDAAREFGRYGA